MKAQPTTNQYLPTPPLMFWEAVLTVRNYLIFHKGKDIYTFPPPQFQGVAVKDALSIIDHFIDVVAEDQCESPFVE